MKRRTFLLGAAAGGALLIGYGLMPPASRVGGSGALPARADAVGLNGWVRVNADGTVNVVLARAEMGQGAHTALPMMVAEEMDLPLSKVRIEPASFDQRYGNLEVLAMSWWFHPDDQQSSPALFMDSFSRRMGRLLGIQITGGSSSVRDAWDLLRQAGASARAMLVGAAAARWQVAAADCKTADGAVVHPDGRRLGYGELAAAAAKIDVPGEVPLKPREQYQLVGTAAPRLDVPAKVNGRTRYGIDVRLPGMLYAAVAGCPVPGGGIAKVDETEARKIPGVLGVVRYEGLAGCAPGVGVVARGYWLARRALDQLAITWDEGPHGKLDSGELMAQMRAALDDSSRSGFTFHERGDGAKALAGAPRVLRADYSAPWLAHAALEPMNCTAQFVDGRLRLWVPTQAASFALETAARASGLSKDRIDLVTTAIGGGFGRRLESDFVVPAVALARAMQPAPVQVIWSREEDMRHDFYRPAAVARLQAALDEKGEPVAWVTKSVSDAITPQFLARNYPLLSRINGPTPDRTQSEGLFDQSYEIPNRHCAHVTFDTPVPVGNWRSVGHSHMAFFSESFVDEMAQAAGRDPYEYRRSLLRNHPRHRAVLELAAEKAGWGRPPAGRALGIALHESFNSIVAQVAEVSIEDKRPRVHRVVCAIDCGTVVNPGIVAQQIEGAVVFGLTATLNGQITLRNGRVEQGNFPDYEVIRLREAPEVQTFIVPSTERPAGVGEPGTPPIAPAVANAVFALTGQRLRSLPLRLG